MIKKLLGNIFSIEKKSNSVKEQREAHRKYYTEKVEKRVRVRANLTDNQLQLIEERYNVTVITFEGLQKKYTAETDIHILGQNIDEIFEIAGHNIIASMLDCLPVLKNCNEEQHVLRKKINKLKRDKSNYLYEIDSAAVVEYAIDNGIN